MATATAELQHCLTIDARYAPLRFHDSAFRTLYIRRRRQLLTGTYRSREYLQLRTQMLKAQFGNTGQGSIRSSLTSIQQQDSNFNNSAYFRSPARPGHNRTSSIVSDTSSIGRPASHQGLSPSSSNSQTKPPPPPTSYVFHGVFHIFDDHKGKVSRLFFLRDDKSRIATASDDGNVVIRQILPGPPSTIAVLRHSCGVIDMDCSETNELLVTAARDATVRLWSLSHGQCMRSITLSSPHLPTVAKFIPLNNNFILVGTSRQIVQLINISTGRSVKRGSGKINGQALSVCFQRDPKTFWLGDDTGSIYAFTYDMAVSSLSKINRVTISDGAPIQSLACRIMPSIRKLPSASNKKVTSHSIESLLLIGAGSSLWLFTISNTGTPMTLSPVPINSSVLKPVCQLPLRLESPAIFAPLLTPSRWLVVAGGTSDQNGPNVAILGVDAASANPDMVFAAGVPQVLTALPGHSSAISCLDFAYDESLLATADATGTVIVWRR